MIREDRMGKKQSRNPSPSRRSTAEIQWLLKKKREEAVLAARKHFGEEVRALREEKGLSREGLVNALLDAKEVTVHLDTLEKIEKDKGDTTLETALVISKGLGKPLARVVFGFEKRREAVHLEKFAEGPAMTPSRFRELFGLWVQALRNARGFASLRDFAAAVDVSLSHLSEIEGGIASPSITVAEKIAFGLGCPLSVLVAKVEAGEEPGDKDFMVYIPDASLSTLSAEDRLRIEELINVLAKRTPASKTRKRKTPFPLRKVVFNPRS